MTKLTVEEAVWARDAARRVITQVERAIIGKHDAIELLMVALLARGHVLIEDIPGVGKTMLAKSLAKALGGTFKRIQFTPDLLPGDVTGLTTYNQKTEAFVFNPGPIFANVMLADEINRATPKTQSALLESMEEAQVTADGTTRALPQPFLVLATQNPIEYRGTYPLPEAQMDRFLLRLRMGYPDEAHEAEMLERHIEAGSSEAGQAQPNQSAALLDTVETALSIDEASQLPRYRVRVHVAEPIRRYIVAITRATRSHPHVLLGASPRASLALQRAAQAAAIMAGREYITPDDVKKVALVVLPHRLIMQEQGGQTGVASSADRVVHQVLAEVAVP